MKKATITLLIAGSALLAITGCTVPSGTVTSKVIEPEHTENTTVLINNFPYPHY